MATLAITVIGADKVTIHLGQIAAGVRIGGHATVGSTLPYSKAVHDGWGPRRIVPRNKQALYWKGLARPIAVVNHPGYKGNPYLYRGLDAAIPAIVGIAQAGVGIICATGAGTIRDLVLRPAAEAAQNDARVEANRKTGALIRDIHTTLYAR